MNTKPVLSEKLLFILVCSIFGPNLHAYLGPGLGAGTIAVVVGLGLSILVAGLALFWFPLKRRLKKSKQEKSNQEKGEASE